MIGGLVDYVLAHKDEEGNRDFSRPGVTVMRESVLPAIRQWPVAIWEG